ncbi:molybdenum cofactor biosynthesis protein MoeB [Fulvitalea axinellae]|uniref:Molybdopterin-synthase adenylyltransferase n=1 Tax=Fulvitalea axinellae TaxID=1182444 RepID=A0AAU9DG99_9BACT|nr:molybdenum cofactor biosynthesis protein MoeB [Fulvitalea axinellae]
MNPAYRNRYSRHLILEQIGEAGQEKLLASKVLIIGAGGLGCPVAQYLVAAGVGTVGIVDFDSVDESNLQRQILFGVLDVGKNKALCAKARLEALNPTIEIRAYTERITPENALGLIAEYDIVVDGTDNFSTRYLLNDACVILGKPLVFGAIQKFSGQVSVFNYKGGPTYRCVFPEPPAPGESPTCSEIGVLGVLPGLVGTKQANEVLKMILGIGETLSGRLLLLDALFGTENVLEVVRTEEGIRKALDEADSFSKRNYERFCGLRTEEKSNTISSDRFFEFLRSGNAVVLDVREEYEEPKFPKEWNAVEIPFAEVKNRSVEIDARGGVGKTLVIVCQVGVRSAVLADFLRDNSEYSSVVHLEEGALALPDTTLESDG